MWQSIRSFLLQPRTLMAIYILAAIIASIQAVMLGNHDFVMPRPNAHDMLSNPDIMRLYIGHHFTEYNNYVIFKKSFFHLIAGKNLYAIYPAEQWDLYKYSPTFALLMGALAYLPDIIGLSTWNILNALVLFAAIRMLPFKNKTQSLLLWFIALELLTSMQNAQSNGLLAGLMIAASCFMQRGKHIWATLLLVFAAYIKVYGAIGFCLFLFYPEKIKFILFAILWTILLFLLPLIVTPFQTLVWQYQNWAQVLSADQSAAFGLSVMGWLHSWFGINRGKTYVTIVGIILFFLPFIRFRLYHNQAYRLLVLASMLIWVIIFNHKAESPTFIIAVAGVGIWYFLRPATQWRTILLLCVLLFTSFSNTDLFPPYIKQNFIVPYTIKVVPCILLWVVTFVELMTMKNRASLSSTGAFSTQTDH
jgi:hypothetical protein